MPNLFAESQIRGPDYVMIIGYFALMLGIGAYFYRYMRGMKAFFGGGNKIPWWLSGVSFYMSSFSAYAFVVFSGMCFRIGWIGLTLFWVSMPAALFSAMLFSALWRRARTLSPVEFLETRYNATVRQIFAWGGVPIGLIDDSLKLIATATVMNIALGIPFAHMIVICGFIMIAYTFMGGLWAVAVTDFVQFAILAVAVLSILPLAIARAGGLSGMAAYAPTGLQSFTNEKYNWFYLLMLLCMYCVAWSSTNWHLIQKYFCVATEKDAKKVGLLVVVLYIVGPPLILLPSIAAPYYLPQETIEKLLAPGADRTVYPVLCTALLPVGMLGLVVAAMFSSTMGNLSSHFNVWASVLTNDIYRRLFRPHAGDRELVAVGRGMTVLVGSATVLAALLLQHASADDLFNYMVLLFSSIVPALGIPMLLGLVTRSVNARSVLAAMIGNAIVIPTVLVLLHFVLPAKLSIGGLLLSPGSIVFAVGAVLTLSILFGVSALFPATEEEKRRVETFHKRLATPIGQLPEERTAEAQSGEVFSPFGIVGISIALIGVLMLAIVLFIDDPHGMLLTAIIGFGMVMLGLLMAWGSSRAKAKIKQVAATAALGGEGK